MKKLFLLISISYVLASQSYAESGFEWPEEIKRGLQKHKLRMGNGEFFFSFDAASQPLVDGKMECNNGQYRIQFQYPDSPEIVLVSRNDASFRLVKDIPTKIWKPSTLARQPYAKLAVFPDLHFPFAFNGTDFLTMPTKNMELLDGNFSSNGEEYSVSWHVKDEIEASGKFVFKREFAWGCAEVITHLEAGGATVARAEYSGLPDSPLLSKVTTASNGERETTTVLRLLDAKAVPPDRFSLEQFGLSESLLGGNKPEPTRFPWYVVFLIVGVSLLVVCLVVKKKER
jgi:hypothetical protein